MKITWKGKQDTAWNASEGWHIVTYAEDGFSPLEIHGRHFGIPREQIAAFAAEVNEDQNLSSLMPDAPITAVPRGMIRESTDEEMLATVISAFLHLYMNEMQATRVAFDFRTPRVPRHAIEAIRLALEQAPQEGLSEILVIDDLGLRA